jgi:hypothetical protein
LFRASAVPYIIDLSREVHVYFILVLLLKIQAGIALIASVLHPDITTDVRRVCTYLGHASCACDLDGNKFSSTVTEVLE